MDSETFNLIEKAKEAVADEGVFSPDQINLLNNMLEALAMAIEKEAVHASIHCH